MRRNGLCGYEKIGVCIEGGRYGHQAGKRLSDWREGINNKENLHASMILPVVGKEVHPYHDYHHQLMISFVLDVKLIV